MLAVIIADVPEAPENGPVSDVELTSPTSLRVVYDEPGNGGSQLINYEIQMDNGLGGGFVTIAGGDLNEHLRQYATVSYLGVTEEVDVYNVQADAYSYFVQRGLLYRFRYRA